MLAASAQHPCLSVMDEHTPSLMQQFRHIISLASLACTFTTLHTLQYMQDHSQADNDNTTAQTTEDHDLTTFPASSSTHNAPVSTENTEKASASSRWTESEITLLLDYIEANCVLMTSRGLTLKKTAFNKARDTVKTKDASQCHYKWGHARIFIFEKCFHH